MRLPTLFTAAVAGLWQYPVLPEETVTSTRHVHITRTVTAVKSTIYAMRVGTSTLIMDYVPASITAKASSQAEMQSAAALTLSTTSTATSFEPTPARAHCKNPSEHADPSGHLELRSAGDTTSIRHVQVTMTVQSVEATVYATSVGSSVSTLTSVPSSLVAEASAEVLAESSAEVFAISSAEAEAQDHSTVGALVTEAPEGAAKVTIQSTLDITNTTSLNTAGTAKVTSTETSAPQISVPNSASTTVRTTSASVVSTDSTVPIGLELRSDSDETSTSHILITKTIAETQSTIYEMQLSSTTSSMVSVPSTIIAIASSEAAAASSTVAVDAASATETTETNVRSTQTALVENEATSSSQGSLIYETTATTASTLSSSSTTSTSISSETTTSTQSTASTVSSDIILTTLTTAWTPSTSSVSSASSSSSEVASTIEKSASASSEAAATTGTAYSSEASSAAVAADNAAGASGSDTSSFKLSQGGFVAIISVVSVGVGLGILFLILFVIAKRRQWRIRASISRASRRVTGRFNPSRPQPSEKPTLPIIQPRSAIPSIPARSEIRNARTAGVGADRTPYRTGTVRAPGGATRFPVRPARPSGLREVEGAQQTMASGALGGAGNRSGMVGPGSSGIVGSGGREGRSRSAERKKPELRVDTQLARSMEEGGVRAEERNWVGRLISRVRGRE